MPYGYTTEITDNCAKAVGDNLPISHKQSVMICQAIRGKHINRAKNILEDVIDMREAIAFTRYNKDMAHRPGNMAAGRYPVKACEHILNIIKSAEANAQYKGLSTGNLIIKQANAQKGPGVVRYGRRRNDAKRTHIEIVLEEHKKPAKAKPEAKTEAKQ